MVFYDELNSDQKNKKKTMWLYGCANSGKSTWLDVFGEIFKASEYVPVSNYDSVRGSRFPALVLIND